MLNKNQYMCRHFLIYALLSIKDNLSLVIEYYFFSTCFQFPPRRPSYLSGLVRHGAIIHCTWIPKQILFFILTPSSYQFAVFPADIFITYTKQKEISKCLCTVPSTLEVFKDFARITFGNGNKKSYSSPKPQHIEN